MKKTLLIVLAVVAIIVIASYSFFKSNYNSMVAGNEQVKASWSQVENQYQRRADLIPNLVATVKGYASHEQETLMGVVEARSKATSVNINAEDLNKETFDKYASAQGELSAALGKLLAISENYPDLKANENFIALQTQLEGTENRIATERKRYNDTAKTYNTMIKTFPRNIVAGMFDFESVEYFNATEGANKPVKVEF